MAGNRLLPARAAVGILTPRALRDPNHPEDAQQRQWAAKGQSELTPGVYKMFLYYSFLGTVNFTQIIISICALQTFTKSLYQ